MLENIWLVWRPTTARAISLTVMTQFNDAYIRHQTIMIKVKISTDTSNDCNKYNGYDVNRNRDNVFFKNINTNKNTKPRAAKVATMLTMELHVTISLN